jgi:hypothetical protein
MNLKMLFRFWLLMSWKLVFMNFDSGLIFIDANVSVDSLFAIKYNFGNKNPFLKLQVSYESIWFRRFWMILHQFFSLKRFRQNRRWNSIQNLIVACKKCCTPTTATLHRFFLNFLIIFLSKKLEKWDFHIFMHFAFFKKVFKLETAFNQALSTARIKQIWVIFEEDARTISLICLIPSIKLVLTSNYRKFLV